MLEIKLTKIHKTVELSPNSIYKYTNLVDVIMPQNRMFLSELRLVRNSKMIRNFF
jgi:hypothetical protein